MIIVEATQYIFRHSMEPTIKWQGREMYNNSSAWQNLEAKNEKDRRRELQVSTKSRFYTTFILYEFPLPGNVYSPGCGRIQMKFPE